MKDVIFQGSRNRQPSGMAEVVLHMVRDETVEHEPDIEDIDSTLEEIDDQAVQIEELTAEHGRGGRDARAGLELDGRSRGAATAGGRLWKPRRRRAAAS